MEVKVQTPPPVLIHHNGTQLLEPHGTSKEIHVKINEKIILFCSVGFTISDEQRLDVECVGDDKYRINESDEKHYLINELTCNGRVKPTIRTNGSCLDSNNNEIGTIIQIGFEGKGLSFIGFLEICHDEETQQNFYAKFTLKPNNFEFQLGEARPKFVKGAFYKNTSVDKLYSKETVLRTLTKLLGKQQAEHFTKLDFLARGHMMARADTIFYNTQMATFIFINAFAQWQKVNSGDYGAFEATLRQFIADEGIVVEVITGTIGVLRLPDINGQFVEIYLNIGDDEVENNSESGTAENTEKEEIRKLPVPLFAYKMIIDRESKTGVVIICINNPFIDRATFDQELEAICTDVTEHLNWVQFKNVAANGFMAACNVKQFTAKVPHLPKGIADEIDTLMVGHKEKMQRNKLKKKKT